MSVHGVWLSALKKLGLEAHVRYVLREGTLSPKPVGDLLLHLLLHRTKLFLKATLPLPFPRKVCGLWAVEPAAASASHSSN